MTTAIISKDKAIVKVYGRLAFAELIEGNKDGKKTANLLMPKDLPAPGGCVGPEELMGIIHQLGVNKFGNFDIWGGKAGLKDGDKCFAQATGEPYAGYPGHWSIRMSTYKNIGVVQYVAGVLQHVPIEDFPNKLYSGAWVIASLIIKPYDFISDNNMRTTGVTSYVSNILFVKDDVSLGGGGKDAEDDFNGIGSELVGSEDPANYMSEGDFTGGGPAAAPTQQYQPPGQAPSNQYAPPGQAPSNQYAPPGQAQAPGRPPATAQGMTRPMSQNPLDSYPLEDDTPF